MPDKITLSLVAAVADNGVIGNKGALPFRLSTDLKHFKAVTMGKPVLMGRKTFESIGKPLPGRPNLVLTSNESYQSQGVEIYNDIDIMLQRARIFAKALNVNEICVIGGAELYSQMMAEADLLRITHVHACPEGDTLFPSIDPDVWTKSEEHHVKASPKDEADMTFCVYKRR
jgi:dihydrofolate reductase